MKTLFLLVSFWCLTAFFDTSEAADNLTCWTHTTSPNGSETAIQKFGCTYCGYHSWDGSCSLPQNTNRYCFGEGENIFLPYTDSNGLAQNYTATDGHCFKTQQDQCIQRLKICDTDFCNMACSSTLAQYSLALLGLSTVIFAIKNLINI